MSPPPPPCFPSPPPFLPEKREPDDLRPVILATCSHPSRLPTLLMKDSKQYQPHAALWWHRAAALRAPHVSSTFGHLQSDPHVAQQELKDNLQRVPSFHVSVCRFFCSRFSGFAIPTGLVFLYLLFSVVFLSTLAGYLSQVVHAPSHLSGDLLPSILGLSQCFVCSPPPVCCSHAVCLGYQHVQIDIWLRSRGRSRLFPICSACLCPVSWHLGTSCSCGFSWFSTRAI